MPVSEKVYHGPVEPEDLTVEDLEDLLDEDAMEWEGQCYRLAHAASKLVKGRPVYGHYTGPVNEWGYWGDRAGLPFQQHGWVQLPDGRVLDPTRWLFEGADPYVYIGSDEDYDEGGNVFRSLLMKPPPRWGDEKRTVELSFSGAAAKAVRSLLGPEEVRGSGGVVKMNLGQAMWLANLPYDILSPHQKEIYDALIEKSLAAFIPLDNRLRAEAEGAQ